MKTRDHFTIAVRTRDPELADIAAAEAWDAGAVGVEERDGAEDMGLLVYSPAPTLRAVLEALKAAVADAGFVAEPELLDDVDWSTAWRQGARETRISERLIIRPSYVPVTLTPGQKEIVIDPGQAFGTGGHASTLLALRWIDDLAEWFGGLEPAARVLDVGTGTGVLALASLACGAGSAVGFDLDRRAVPEARHWARENGLAPRIEVFVGSIDAIRGDPFDLVTANLLKREMLPIVSKMIERLRPSGRLVASGLLEEELSEVENYFGAVGWECADVKRTRDANGDAWVGLLFRARQH